MFGILYTADDGAKVFKVCETLEAADYLANNIACTGCGVTVFEYDHDDGCYTELFEM